MKIFGLRLWGKEPVAREWHHVAVTGQKIAKEDGTTEYRTMLFLDGVLYDKQDITIDFWCDFKQGSSWMVQPEQSPMEALKKFPELKKLLDEDDKDTFRVSKSCRWKENFTPPTAEYPGVAKKVFNTKDGDYLKTPPPEDFKLEQGEISV